MRILLIFTACAVLMNATGTAAGDAETALERLALVTEKLIEIGEDMVGEPISGTVALGDTVSQVMNLSTGYAYHVHIWTDSIFNLLGFWITAPDRSLYTEADGDNTALSIFPDTSGEWTIHILLEEGWYGDTVGYAAALFRYPRQSSAIWE